jgi:hypothetical protein
LKQSEAVPGTQFVFDENQPLDLPRVLGREQTVRLSPSKNPEFNQSLRLHSHYSKIHPSISNQLSDMNSVIEKAKRGRLQGQDLEERSASVGDSESEGLHLELNVRESMGLESQDFNLGRNDVLSGTMFKGSLNEDPFSKAPRIDPNSLTHENVYLYKPRTSLDQAYDSKPHSPSNSPLEEHSFEEPRAAKGEHSFDEERKFSLNSDEA